MSYHKFHYLICLFYFSTSYSASAQCNLTAPSVACVNESITISFSSESSHNNVVINAFSQVENMNIPALVQNISDNTADIIFLQEGNAEIVIQYFQNNDQVDACNQNIFIFDGDPITQLGMVSDFLGDINTCENLNVDFNNILPCSDCIQTWTLDGTPLPVQESIVLIGGNQIINTSLSIDSLGMYDLCQRVYKSDSTCFAEDCITISITEIADTPTFSILDENDQSYCLGSSIGFINETMVNVPVSYKWTITYDSLIWNYYADNIEFEFNNAGTYQIDLQYTLDNTCKSQIFSKEIIISNAASLLISCDGQLCESTEITYRAPAACDMYQWEVDPEFGIILLENDSIITVQWKEVDVYTDTKISLSMTDCDTDICTQSSREVSLFPSTLDIDGTFELCNNGEFDYTADYIPDAVYDWQLIILDSISGVSPLIVDSEYNMVSLEVFSFVGAFELQATASIDENDCSVAASQIIRRYNILNSDMLCKEDLFKAELFPKINEDVVWTIYRPDSTIFKQEVKSGLSNFLAFGFPQGGTYYLTAAIPSIGFECESEIPFSILNVPTVNLEGPTKICEGQNYNYTLSDLGANDIVEWTIFQNGMPTNQIGNTVNVTWEEGGAPYVIRVIRSTEYSPNQICESSDFIIEISTIEIDDVQIMGEDTVCYDAISQYTMSFDGSYEWSIEPPYMGTIIAGDSTESITVQWHYAPNITQATISTESTICDENIKNDLHVTFAPFTPILDLPDSICRGTSLRLEVANLNTYDIIEYYINGELVIENRSSYQYTFLDTGWVNIEFQILNPNECPGLSIASHDIYVKPVPSFVFDFSNAVIQCPKDVPYNDVTVSCPIQSPEYYYQWVLDNKIIAEGFGSDDLYKMVITQVNIDQDTTLSLTITSPNECSHTENILLDYPCDPPLPKCECKEEVIAEIDYITRHECNLISFGGSIDFSTVLYAEWRIPQGDTITLIPIVDEDDLTQDSLYLSEDLTSGDVTLRVICDGQIPIGDGIFTDTLCDFIQETISFPLFLPKVDLSYECTDGINYKLTFTNRRYPTSPPADEYMLNWIINGVSYLGEIITLPNIAPEMDINISLTQCTLDGAYCCTSDTIINAPKAFDPMILLPDGSCENSLWTFATTIDTREIQSILWDFGDESGSTLPEVMKGYEVITDEQNIIVTVTNDRGCVGSDTLSVQSFPNTIDGIIIFDEAPCAQTTAITYVEQGKSEIASYNWNTQTDVDSSSIIISESGIYTVTVTDIHGCTSSATTDNISVNESFSGGISIPEMGCGNVTAYIGVNKNFIYTWYVDSIAYALGSNLTLSEAGEYEIMIISSHVMDKINCDTLHANIIVHPNPELPDVSLDKVYCDPFITELTVHNYPSVTWDNYGIVYEGNTLITSTSGLYTATYTDDNGCSTSRTLNVEDTSIDFDYLSDICVQACREDLDSLALYIPGNTSSFVGWSWKSLDSLGTEYIVAQSVGSIPPLRITDRMYSYAELVIETVDCDYTSGRIPLDIIQCTIIEDEDEIICDSIDIFSDNCGLTVYECLVSEVNGGPKLYYEGHIEIPESHMLCNDSLKATLNSGHIDILDFSIINDNNGSVHIEYSANIYIHDIQQFEANETYISFAFCDENGIFSYCLNFKLPYRNCGNDFDCMIDCISINYGTDETVNVLYCLNLTDVVQENCTLESYHMTLALANDQDSKIIYEATIMEDYDALYCLYIPIPIDDFTSGAYECLEMIVTGDCPDIVCYDYQCGAFSSGLANRAGELPQARNIQITKPISSSELKIYPNPTTGIINIQQDGVVFGDRMVITNTLGQNIIDIPLDDDPYSTIDISEYDAGIYVLHIKTSQWTIMSKKIVLLK